MNHDDLIVSLGVYPFSTAFGLHALSALTRITQLASFVMHEKSLLSHHLRVCEHAGICAWKLGTHGR